MNRTHPPRRAAREYAWPLVLCLVGVDYFSSLAYLPSIAVSAAGPFAPFAAAGVVAVTFLLALPVYWYIVGRCSDGRGAAGLIERLVPGWRGKLLVLTLLGFAAVDFVITRSLSLADAAIHLVHNPWVRELINKLPVDTWAHGLSKWSALLWLAERVLDRQVVVTIVLSILSLGLWQLLKHGVSRLVLNVAAATVLLYLAATGVVIVAAFGCLLENPDRLTEWWKITVGGMHRTVSGAEGLEWLWIMAGVALWSFPQLALGLSGFEMIMTLSPRVRGRTRTCPEGGVRNMRKLMLTTAATMAIFLMGAVTVTTMLIPTEATASGGTAEHRALAYLVHGEPIVGGIAASTTRLNLGKTFPVLFDAVTVLILCLAGVSVTMSVRTLLPHYLNRLGMDIVWAGRVGGILLTLHGVVFMVTIVFEASPTSQQWAYATSVLVLLAGAAVGALLDLRKAAPYGVKRLLFIGVAALASGFFAAMAGITIGINHAGLTIAGGFIAAIVICSFTSRWLRSTELRFRGFRFADERTRLRWMELQQAGSLVLVPHRPGIRSLAEKCAAVRKDHRLDATTLLLFIEAKLGDPSDFFQKPLMQIEDNGGLELLRVSQCVSVAHVLAAIGLELCSTENSRPTMILGWSNERPLASNLNFLLFGEGNVPWMVKELVRRSKRNGIPLPRIVVG